MSLVAAHFLELDADRSLIELKNSHANLCFDTYALVLGSWVLLDQSELDLVFLAAHNWIHSKSFSGELDQSGF